MAANIPLFIGLDGGGTKCKARLENAQGELLAEAISGPANPAQNPQQAFESMLDASHMALSRAGFAVSQLDHCYVAVGLAGVNIPQYMAVVEAWQHPFKALKITTDLHIACLGAHGGEEGGIVISGTGSSAFACVDGEHTYIGGHGFPLGDKGSGAWLGWQAISSTLDALDGLLETGPLTQLVCNQLGTSSRVDIVAKTLHYAPKEFATFAPLVLKAAESDDPLAVSIIQTGADYVEAVIHRLSAAKPRRLSLIGGVATRLLPWLSEGCQRKLESPLCSPEYGAVSLAKQVFSQE